ncbi:unnamed protein product [Paramecium primaurelia]|uniref:Ubiquitin-like domain-containing protein n=1 Tax=Paramecium primaurelia TaxID=5886 RepID=A0A8S1KTP3_PARPR|nr:unnamed protein product [Paramecium primaurelia]
MASKEIQIILSYKAKSKIYQVQVDTESLVQELISEMHSILQPGNQQILVLYLNNAILDPKKQLKDYNIVKGSQIEIIITTNGGR